MADQIQIYNIALARVGHTKRVLTLSDATMERETCALFYELCRDSVLRDFPWRFAKRTVALTQLEGTPPEKWLYIYEKPTGCLKARYIEYPGNRNPRAEDKIKFEVASISSDDLTYTLPDVAPNPAVSVDVIFTDQDEAVLTYTEQVTDTTRFDPLFVSALAWRLAAELGLPLTGKTNFSSMCMQMYERTVREAAAASLSEGREATPESEFFGARNG